MNSFDEESLYELEKKLIEKHPKFRGIKPRPVARAEEGVVSGFRVPTPEEEESGRVLARYGEGIKVYQSYWASDSLYDTDAKRTSIISFIPVAPGSPCPCGSGKRYGSCCRRLGKDVVFVRDAERSTYRRLLFIDKTFKKFNYDRVREVLLSDSRFACAEDSDERCFWNLLGDPPVTTPYGSLVFGTVELTRSFFMIEAMSRNRFRHLDRVLDDLFGDGIGDAEVETTTQEG